MSASSVRSHPRGKSKIDNYTKTKAKLEDFGLKTAADALHALPSLQWLAMARSQLGSGASPASSWRLLAGNAKQKKRHQGEGAT